MVSFAAPALPEKSSTSAEPLNAGFGMKDEVGNGMVKFVGLLVDGLIKVSSPSQN
jgi:hypothetical protein